MKLPLILVFQFFIFSTIYAQSIFRPNFTEESSDSLEVEEIVIFNHNTKWWDHNSITLRATQSLLAFAREQKITSLGVVHEPAIQEEVYAKQYFFAPGETDLILFSRQGEHQLRFPRLRRAFLSGGFLDQCLCSAIRSVLQGRGLGPGEKLEVIMVADAVYKNVMNTDNLETLQSVNATELKKIAEKYYVSKMPWNCLGVLKSNTIVGIYLRDKEVLHYEIEGRSREKIVFKLHFNNTDSLNEFLE